MDGVELGKEMRGPRGEDVRTQTDKAAFIAKAFEKRDHLSFDMLRVAKKAIGFADARGAEATGPRINFTKQMTMNGAIM